jgi:hypothetical protein
MREILQLLRLLREKGIPFVAVGMSAARLQGAPVVTQDFDLLVPSIDSETMDWLAWKSGAVLSGGREPPCAFNFVDALPVDLVRRLSTGISLEYALAVSRRVKLGRLSIPVLPLEEIIASKKRAGRPKDLAALPVLRQTLRARHKALDSSGKRRASSPRRKGGRGKK